MSVNSQTMQGASPAAAVAEQARPPAVWVVRAHSGKNADRFLRGGFIAIGWFDLSSTNSREDIRRCYEHEYPDAPSGQIRNETSQLAAFRLQMIEGDYVLTPGDDPNCLYHGIITGSCDTATSDDRHDRHRYLNRRTVHWSPTPLHRSRFSQSLQRTLRCPRTVFRVDQRPELMTAVHRLNSMSSNPPTRPRRPMPSAVEAIKDRLIRADLHENKISIPNGDWKRIADQKFHDRYNKAAWRKAARERIVPWSECPRFALRGLQDPDLLHTPKDASAPSDTPPQHAGMDTPRSTAMNSPDRSVNEEQSPAEDYADVAVAPDSGVEDEREDPEQPIEHPFDPSKIKVRTVPVLVDQLVLRIKHEEVNLAPDFQRMHVWDDQRKSRLIESLLLRIPIPVF